MERLVKKYEHEITRERLSNNLSRKQLKSEYITLPHQTASELTTRTTVAGPSSPTHRLSDFIDLILKLLYILVSSYISDELHYLNQIPKQINEDTLLVFFDVVCLYINTPYDLGLSAIQFWLDN